MALCAAGLSTLGSTVRSSTGEQPSDAVSVIDMDWHDTQRKRWVPVRLYLPPVRQDQGLLPLMVFSHGIGGSRNGYGYLGRHWAENGYASLHVQHVGSDRSVWFDGSPFAVVDRLHRAARDSEAISRAGDLRFALDHLLSGPLSHWFDADRIVAAGHSYGANTTLLAVGAKVIRQDQEVDLTDARFKAAILISSPPFYGEASVDRILDSVRVPSLHITATGDTIQIPGYFSPAEDRVQIFEKVKSTQKVLVVFEGGSHSMFTDRYLTGGVLLNPKVKQATREMTTAFLRVLHHGDKRELQHWVARHASIVSRVAATGALLG
jgi:predicted dienelactone hydrolase